MKAHSPTSYAVAHEPKTISLNWNLDTIYRAFTIIGFALSRWTSMWEPSSIGIWPVCFQVPANIDTRHLSIY